jgi:hypothetical protein
MAALQDICDRTAVYVADILRFLLVVQEIIFPEIESGQINFYQVGSLCQPTVKVMLMR